MIYINDFPTVLNNSCKLFADDAKIYRTVCSTLDQYSLQSDLDRALEWSHLWQLSFNRPKCKALHFGNGNPHFSYLLGDHNIEQVTQEKDLGVIIDEGLKFHQQTAAAVNKANTILALIKKSFTLLDEASLPVLFKTYVRPHLEYANIIWGPHFRCDQEAIERVQSRATKLVQCLKDLPYQTRLQKLRLPSMYHRCRRGDLIQLFKIIHGIDRLQPSTFVQMAPLASTRGHSLKLFKPRASKHCRIHFFSSRVIDDWNALTEVIVSAPTINAFKNRLDAHWQHRQYDVPNP